MSTVPPFPVLLKNKDDLLTVTYNNIQYNINHLIKMQLVVSFKKFLSWTSIPK